MKTLKKAAKIMAAVITAVVFVFTGLLIFVTVMEYRPQKTESIKKSEGTREVSREDPFTVVSLIPDTPVLERTKTFLWTEARK